MVQPISARAPVTPRSRGGRAPRIVLCAATLLTTVLLAAMDADRAEARCAATLRVLGPNGQDSAETQPITAVPGQTMRFVVGAPGCRLPASCRLRLFAAPLNPAGNPIRRLRPIAAGDPGAPTFTTTKRSPEANRYVFRAVITCGRKVARSSDTVIGAWQTPPPPAPPQPQPPSQPPAPSTVRHLRLTLTGPQSTASQDYDLVADVKTPASSPAVKANSTRGERVSGTASIDAPLAPGEVLYVRGQANLVYYTLCNGTSGCSFDAPHEVPGADRFDEIVAMICAAPPTSIIGCGDRRIVEVSVDWDA
jgi:hypothetical protein